jgi:hypothetical protein
MFSSIEKRKRRWANAHCSPRRKRRYLPCAEQANVPLARVAHTASTCFGRLSLSSWIWISAAPQAFGRSSGDRISLPAACLALFLSRRRSSCHPSKPASNSSTPPLLLSESNRPLSHMLPSHGARFPSAGHARSIAHIPARKCRAVMMLRTLSRPCPTDSPAAAQQCLSSFSTHSSVTASRRNLHSSSRLSALYTFRNQRRSFWFGSGAKKEGTGTNAHLHFCKII